MKKNGKKNTKNYNKNWTAIGVRKSTAKLLKTYYKKSGVESMDEFIQSIMKRAGVSE